MSATSPADWEDMELGRALREAIEALPNDRNKVLRLFRWLDMLGGGHWIASTEWQTRWGGVGRNRYERTQGEGDTPTAALDALTAALRERSA